MILTATAPLSPWAMLLSAGAYGAGGLLLGLLYFRVLWWNTRFLAIGGRLHIGLALMALRLALLGFALFLAARQGALALLMTALGVILARNIVVPRLRALT